MAENLKVTHYNDGSEIPNITNNGEWGGLSTGAYGNYGNNPTNSETYGRLYNWYVVDDDRGVCPEGFHVPSDYEYTVLTDYLGGESVAGGKMKEEGLDHWNSPNTGATNESGFTGLPAGKRFDATGGYNGIGFAGYFWSSSESGSSAAGSRTLNYGYSDMGPSGHTKEGGCSIRCLADEITTGCTDANATNYDDTANVDDGSCEYCYLGEINGDGSYNVMDVVQLANCVLAENCNLLENVCAADINGDGNYNVMDIVILANCILAENCNS